MDTEFIILIFIGIFASIINSVAGGGGLITLPFMMLFGIPIQTGIATNKFSTTVSFSVNVLYLLRKREITIKTTLTILVVSFFGGVCGAYSTTHIPEQTMRWVAMFLLIFALFVTMQNKAWTTTVSQEPKRKSKIYHFLPFFIGIYDGGFGPGSTTFSILHFIKGSHPYIKAVHYSRVLVLGSCIGAFLVFFQTGFFDWHYAIAMAIGSTIGSQIGLLVLPYIPVKFAKIMLATILVLLMGQISFQLM